MAYFGNKEIEDMRVRIDYNNMLTHSVGEGGIDPAEIDSMRSRMQAAYDGVEAKKDRLRWRYLYKSELENVDAINETADFVRRNAKTFVVLGIGGSALGPIAVHQALNDYYYNDMQKEFRSGPKFYVVDNVDPERMTSLFALIDPAETIFNVITKSGSTSETMAQLLIVTDILIRSFGEEGLKEHVIATTDAQRGSLAAFAKNYGLRTFIVPEGVGGRFSELCPVGLLPAAVCGVDIRAMLAGAQFMDEMCSETDFRKNPAMMLAALEVLAMEKHGANISVLMPYADSLKYMADWYAQLWAESLGKKKLQNGKTVRIGQTPVKSLGVTDQHSQVQLYTDGPFDKTITFLAVEKYRKNFTIPHAIDGDKNVAFLSGHTLNELITAERIATEHAVTVSGHMNKTIILPRVNEFTIGQLIQLFEMQTAFAGELLGIDAFDQPGVEEGKCATYALLGKPGFEEKLKELEKDMDKPKEYII